MNNDKNMKRRRRQQQQQKQKEQHMERDGVDETREEVSSSLTKVDQTHFCFSHFWPEILFFSVERNFFVAILTSDRCQKSTWTFLHLFRRLFAKALQRKCTTLIFQSWYFQRLNELFWCKHFMFFLRLRHNAASIVLRYLPFCFPILCFSNLWTIWQQRIVL